MNTPKRYIYYRPQRSWGKVIFSQACVILFTGGVCLSACWDTTPPPGPGIPLGPGTPPGPGTLFPRTRHPPGPGTPPGTRHPPPSRTRHPRSRSPLAQSMLGDTVNARAVRILLECNLVYYIKTQKDLWQTTHLFKKVHITVLTLGGVISQYF